jgi:hypothetical protein
MEQKKHYIEEAQTELKRIKAKQREGARFDLERDRETTRFLLRDTQ